MSDIFANPKVTRLSQELLNAKMLVKWAAKAEARNCARCIADELERKEKQARGDTVTALPLLILGS